MEGGECKINFQYFQEKKKATHEYYHPYPNQERGKLSSSPPLFTLSIIIQVYLEESPLRTIYKSAPPALTDEPPTIYKSLTNERFLLLITGELVAAWEERVVIRVSEPDQLTQVRAQAHLREGVGLVGA